MDETNDNEPRYQQLIKKIECNDERMKEVDFSNQQLDESFARILSNFIGANTNLTYMNLSNNQLGDKGATLIAKAMAENKGLVSVDLRWNKISLITIGLFVTAIKNNFQLVKLEFEEKEYDVTPALLAIKPHLQVNEELAKEIESSGSLHLSNKKIQSFASIESKRNAKIVNISQNQIKFIPETLQWKNVTELDLSFNQVSKIPKSILTLQSLKVFKINNNKLREIPIQVAMLPNLEELDIGNNSIIHLDLIPLTSLSNHNKLKSLVIAGNPFMNSCKNGLPTGAFEVSKAGSKVLKLVKKSRKGEIVTNSFTTVLFFLGSIKSGKTSTIRSLMYYKKSNPVEKFDKMYENANTSFVKHNWRIYTKENQESTIQQTELYSDYLIYDWNSIDPTYKLYLSTNSMYLITISLPMKEERLIQTKQYIDTINTYTNHRGMVILIITHCELFPSEKVIEIMHHMKSLFPDIYKILPLSNTSGLGIKNLKSHIIQLTKKIPNYGRPLPYQFNYLIENLRAFKLSANFKPILTKEEFLPILQEISIPESDHEKALQFLHDTGKIIYWNNKQIRSKFIVLDFKLISSMFQLLINDYRRTSSVLFSLSKIPVLWKGFSENIQNNVREILETFDILSRTVNTQIALIPYFIPYHKPLIAMALPHYSKRRVWRRLYKLNWLPSNFLDRLINGFLSMFSKVLMWRSGILFSKNSEISISSELGIIELDNLSNQIYFEIPCTWPPSLFSQLISIIEELIVSYIKLDYSVMIPCIHCIQKKKLNPFDAFRFYVTELIQVIDAGDKNVVCKKAQNFSQIIRINTLAPDVTLKTMKHLIIDYSDLEFIEERGVGTSGKVFKAIYQGKPVAVKMLNQHSNTQQDKRARINEFRKEASIMTELSDQNLVQLKGLVVNPELCVIQEYCPVGDLCKYLSSYYESHQSPPPFRYSLLVAFNIAKGMQFLHNYEPPILHRDLKSPNILLTKTVDDYFKTLASTNSHNRDILHIAKISDFGLSSQFHLPNSVRVVDNPLWLAPEIMAQKPFTKKSDVYSFGIILWELVTGQLPFSEFHFDFACELEEQICKFKLRPTIPNTVLEDYADLIKQCWEASPENRPGFRFICDSLWRIMLSEGVVTDMTLPESNSDFDSNFFATTMLDSASDSDVDEAFCRRRAVTCI